MAKGHENLKPFNTLTEEEHRKLAKKGGKASGKARAERKTLREELLALLANGDTQERISLSMIQEALNGNVKAFETIRDTIGEKPVEKAEVKTEVKTISVTIEDDDE